MDGLAPKQTLSVQRSYVPNRLSEPTLVAVYDHLLRTLAAEQGHHEQREPVVVPDPSFLVLTGGPS